MDRIDNRPVFTAEHHRWFERYEKVRDSGKFNMIMDSANACVAAHLTKDQYLFVIKNYSALKDSYSKRNIRLH